MPRWRSRPAFLLAAIRHHAAMQPLAMTWPFTGLFHFLLRPGLWVRAALGFVLAALILVGLFGLGLWHWWPEPDPAAGWWAWLQGHLVAVAAGLVAAMAGWFLLTPWIMGFAFERLAVRVLVDAGCTVPGEGLLSGTRSALRVLLRTLHWRLLWPLLALLLASLPVLFLLAPLVAVVGTCHLAVLDAGDLALALRGQDGRQRIALLRSRQRSLLATALVAAGMLLFLGLTVLGPLLFMPAMVTGAARWVATLELSAPAASADAAPLAGPESSLPAAGGS